MQGVLAEVPHGFDTVVIDEAAQVAAATLGSTVKLLRSPGD